MTERLGADALRELFLFEKLSHEQLDWLADRGKISSYSAGVTVYSAGEPATRLFVLLDGSMCAVRCGGTEIEMDRTDYRGTYAGAFLAYLDLPIAACTWALSCRDRLPLLGVSHRSVRCWVDWSP